MYEKTIAGLRKIVHDYKGRLTPYMRLTICEATDAIEELSKQVEQLPRWIPVTEQPPLEVGDDGYNGYLVFANGYYEVADYASDEFDNVPYFHVDGEWEPTVTHFMPLPEPPKEET